MIGRLILEDISELLHISNEASEIYVSLLKHGTLSKEETKNLLNLKDKKLQEATDELISRNLIYKRYNDEKKEVFEAASIMQLEEKLERDKEAIVSLRDAIVPSIKPMEKINLVRYEGFEGIRKVYLEVLEEAIKTKEPILAFETIPDKEDSPIGKIFLENYLARRIENGVQAKVIAPRSKASEKYKANNDNHLTQTKLLDDFHLRGTINIAGDLVMTYSVSPPIGTLRKNAMEAESLKAIFYKLWENKK